MPTLAEDFEIFVNGLPLNEKNGLLRVLCQTDDSRNVFDNSLLKNNPDYQNFLSSIKPAAQQILTDFVDKISSITIEFGDPNCKAIRFEDEEKNCLVIDSHIFVITPALADDFEIFVNGLPLNEKNGLLRVLSQTNDSRNVFDNSLLKNNPDYQNFLSSINPTAQQILTDFVDKISRITIEPNGKAIEFEDGKKICIVSNDHIFAITSIVCC